MLSNIISLGEVFLIWAGVILLMVTSVISIIKSFAN